MTANPSTPAVNRYFGAPVTRNEDPALLTGQALFVDDLVLTEMWHAALLRSPHAHARIESIDVTAAKARDGVIAVYTAEDLGDFWQSVPLVVPPPPIPDLVFNKHTQVPLAKDKVRYAGSRSSWSWPRAATSPRTRSTTSSSTTPPCPSPRIWKNQPPMARPRCMPVWPETWRPTSTRPRATTTRLWPMPRR